MIPRFVRELQSFEDLAQDVAGRRTFRRFCAIHGRKLLPPINSVANKAVGPWGRNQRADDIGMDQPRHPDSLLAQVVDVVGIGGDFDGGDLVGPHVVVGGARPRHRRSAQLFFQHIFADALARIKHPHREKGKSFDLRTR